MNISTLIGIAIGLLVVGTAIFNSAGNPSLFWNPNGLAIVLGGVFAATFICYPLSDIRNLLSSLSKVLRKDDLPSQHYINALVQLAKLSMAKSPLKLEQEMQTEQNYFLKDGLRMLIDQYPAAKLRHIMTISINNTVDRELSEAAIFRTMARFSPAFGMVGTLIGLIVMFQNLGSNPGVIGGAIGVAMMSTLYGLLFANLIFNPIAVKVERKIEDRERLMRLIMEGLLLVSNRTPPQIVRDELKGFLPTGKWTDLKVIPVDALKKKKTAKAHKKNLTKADPDQAEKTDLLKQRRARLSKQRAAINAKKATG
ncbi:MAG: MotA/TolQ/ExbB proton channel family protein [Pseudomonadales bacterium]|nr:MotA/TolQ/ExbB proton channel family protein [Pseudomonadales bacterium]